MSSPEALFFWTINLMCAVLLEIHDSVGSNLDVVRTVDVVVVVGYGECWTAYCTC